MGFFQCGGGTTSPKYSYIYCKYLRIEVKVDPPLGNDHNIPIKRILIPTNCPMQDAEYKKKQNDKELKSLQRRATPETYNKGGRKKKVLDSST
jgi:hypothetical protein